MALFHKQWKCLSKKCIRRSLMNSSDVFTNLEFWIYEFLTAISHRGLRNCFFFAHLLSIFYLDFYIPFLFGLFSPFSIWTFISLFYLDFYFPFLFGLLSPFFIWTFISRHFGTFRNISTGSNNYKKLISMWT